MEQEGKLQATALAVLADDLDRSGFAELQMPTVEPPAELSSPDPDKVAGMPTSVVIDRHGLRACGREWLQPPPAAGSIATVLKFAPGRTATL